MSKRRKCGYFLITVLLILVIAWLAWPAKGVPVLAYHQVSYDDDLYSVSPDDFERQMDYLASQGYSAVTLEDLTQYMAGSGQLPDKPVVITFDDGYQDNYTTALPIMEKYGMRSTVFVITDKIGQPGYLSWQEIRDMRRRGTDIGSHTVGHVVMSDISLDECQKEVTVSKQLLEQGTGQLVKYLAYPYGKFDIAMFDILRQAGYKGACAGITGLNKLGENPFRIKRIGIPRSRAGLLEFKLRLFRASVYSKIGR
ncbi:MAG: polysaccharide deacetylase [Firmicutes bacterium]|nr:polysaccharide deacetylase [Bacillota bacterium]